MCDLSAEVREFRGTLTQPGRNSPFRERGVEENLDLFRRMRAGEFADGAKTHRAKIDMASGNINLRDPALYRIRHVPHQNTGNAWCIYPMYDYATAFPMRWRASPFAVHAGVRGPPSAVRLVPGSARPAEPPAAVRPLVDAGLPTRVSRPQQIEFARGNLDHTVMSKRKLMALVQDGLVDGWDDPRMPTLSGARGAASPWSIRTF